MSLGANKANTIRAKIEGGFASDKDKTWLKKWEEKQKQIQNKLKIKIK